MALHGLWLMVIGPAVGIAVAFLDPRKIRPIGLALLAVGLAVLLGFLGWAVLTWKPSYQAMTPRMLGLRFGFLVATATDLPAVQCMLSGLGVLIAGRFRRPSTQGVNPK